MSIEDKNNIDGIAISKDDEQKLMLLVTDHLDWQNEYEHLILLQDKINAYIGFLEIEQYKEVYPEKVFTLFCIEVHFKYETTNNCVKFIENNIVVEMKVS
jgi:hypothetical protein